MFLYIYSIRAIDFNIVLCQQLLTTNTWGGLPVPILRFGLLWTKRRLCLPSTSQLGKTVISNCLTRRMYLGFRPLPSELPSLHKRSVPRFVLVWLK